MATLRKALQSLRFLPGASRLFWPPRPATGIVTEQAGFFGGIDEVTIENTNGDLDAAVVLLASDHATQVAWIYVRHSEQYTFDGLQDGTYNLCFTTGAGWDPGSYRFTSQQSYTCMQEPASLFSQHLTITLYRVANGNAPSCDVDGSGFPPKQGC